MFTVSEERSFLGWMRETGNVFTGDEYHFRFGIWMTNKRIVQSHNAANLGFTLALNKFAHFTPSEYKALLGNRIGRKNIKQTPKGTKIAEDSIDWRTKGVVNPIKDQGPCGSCWAFSAIQVVESQVAITKNTLYSLSEQNILDCDTQCAGCNGG